MTKIHRFFIWALFFYCLLVLPFTSLHFPSEVTKKAWACFYRRGNMYSSLQKNEGVSRLMFQCIARKKKLFKISHFLWMFALLQHTTYDIKRKLAFHFHEKFVVQICPKQFRSSYRSTEFVAPTWATAYNFLHKFS